MESVRCHNCNQAITGQVRWMPLLGKMDTARAICSYCHFSAALRFYADQENWIKKQPSAIEMDGGRRAREALRNEVE